MYHELTLCCKSAWLSALHLVMASLAPMWVGCCKPVALWFLQVCFSKDAHLLLSFRNVREVWQQNIDFLA